MFADLDTRERERLGKSGLLGALLWAVALGTLLLIPSRPVPPMDQEFLPVVLRLTQQPSEPARASPKKEAPETRQTPVAKEPRATRSPSSPAKAKPVATAPDKTSSGLGIPDFDQPLSNSTRGTISGSVASSGISDPQTRPRNIEPVHEFEGAIATISPRQSSEPVVSRSGSVATSASATAETLESLSSISKGASEATTNQSSKATSTRTVSATAVSQDSSSPISFEGTPRRLISPADPSITLPDHLARQIDGDRSVTVMFTVRPDGSVPASLITFSPAALLPSDVRDYLRREFSRWRFERGQDNGQARFVYSISVK